MMKLIVFDVNTINALYLLFSQLFEWFDEIDCTLMLMTINALSLLFS